LKRGVFARVASLRGEPEHFVIQRKSGTFLLTRDTLRHMMPPLARTVRDTSTPPILF
jgi:hypothetical protein